MLNIALITISCIIAHLIPFKLLLISYAFLGPAHYLTEISWLHDRNYFTSRRIDILPVFILCASMFVFPSFFEPLIITTFFYAVAIAVMKSWKHRVIFLAIIIPLTMTISYVAQIGVLWILLPTLIHVFIFTALFMWYGATKSNDTINKISVGFLFLAAGTFFFQIKDIGPLDEYAAQNLQYIKYLFGNILPTFNIKIPDETNRFISFAAFAYTYHYLNWFSKTKVIQWHKISEKRFALILVLYGIAFLAYINNYGLGFFLLSVLSLLHVVLEFPLNAITIQGLVKQNKPSQTSS